MTSQEQEKAVILLVEDEEHIRVPLVEILRKFDYECVAVASCEEARQAVHHAQFSCGLIDLGLPDGQGFTLLPEFKELNPWLVPIILTGDGRPETIIETMRAGAFDFLVKPVDNALLRAALDKAIQHHRAIRDRDRYMEELRIEREQLKGRIDEATADLRRHAEERELINARNHSLLRLTQIASDFYTDEALFSRVFDELTKFVPIECVLLFAAPRNFFCAALPAPSGETSVIATRGSTVVHASEEDEDEDKMREWLGQNTHIGDKKLKFLTFPQVFWNKTFCNVAFLVSPEFEVDEACDEFLSMAAHFLAFEWQDGRLFLHAAQEASLGNIALELTTGFVQSLTAIRTAADFVSETEVSKDAQEGLSIISDNTEILRRQVREFRQISTFREDSVETVHIDRIIDQAFDILSLTIHNKGIAIHKEYAAETECVLLNGTILSRSILEIISNAVRTSKPGRDIQVRLREADKEHLDLEISYMALGPEIFGSSPEGDGTDATFATQNHPKFVLVQRSIHRCGGKLSIEMEPEGRCAFHILLPKNAINP